MEKDFMDTKLEFPAGLAEPAPAASKPEGSHWVTLDTSQRVMGAVVALGCGFVLLVARLLTPDPRGVGTHQQLGLPPCFTLTALHIPCPFCGMTTAFSLMAHGRVAQAFVTQPAGALAFVLAGVAAAAGVWASSTARLPIPSNPDRWQRRTLVLGAALIIGAWLYKVLSVLTSV
jgi:hypothetical protein